MRALRTDGPVTRFGFTTSKALGNAVVRNRVRRRLREGAAQMPVAEGWDVVFNSRVPVAKATFHEIQDQMRDLLDRAGLLEQEAL